MFGVATHSGLATKAEDKAEILSAQFKSVFTAENTSTQPSVNMPVVQIMPSIHISTSGVELLLQHIQPHKASGPDTIPARVMKECASSVAPPLAVIFRKSLQTGDVRQTGETQTSRRCSKRVDLTIQQTTALYRLHRSPLNY